MNSHTQIHVNAVHAAVATGILNYACMYTTSLSCTHARTLSLSSSSSSSGVLDTFQVCSSNLVLLSGVKLTRHFNQVRPGESTLDTQHSRSSPVPRGRWALATATCLVPYLCNLICGRISWIVPSMSGSCQVYSTL